MDVLCGVSSFSHDTKLIALPRACEWYQPSVQMRGNLPWNPASIHHAAYLGDLSSCRVMRRSPSPPKKRRLFVGLLLDVQTHLNRSITVPTNNPTQNDDMNSQRHSWRDPISLSPEHACGNHGQNSQRKRPAQASLTAEGFVFLVDFQTSCTRLEKSRK